MPSNQPAFDLTNFLLGLAWLGELDRRQIAQLWFSDKSASTVQKTLTELRKDELIAPRAWSVRDAEKGVTAPQLALVAHAAGPRTGQIQRAISRQTIAPTAAAAGRA